MDRETLRRIACCELVKDVACGGSDVRLMVSGASMIPALWPGDVVTVRQCAIAEFEPGEIAVFRQDEKLVIHRIERVSGDRLITRGDARPRFDSPVQPSEIVGRVVSIARGGRSVDPGRSLGPERTLWQRAAASILRRSDFCTRVTLYVNRRLRRAWHVEAGEIQTPLCPKP